MLSRCPAVCYPRSRASGPSPPRRCKTPGTLEPAAAPPADDLSGFACPHDDCSHFNLFNAGNLSVCERMGKSIRRLYCSACGGRFSERKGTLREYGKLPEETVVRIVKCLAHGCSIEAAADICEVSPRTVELLLHKAGKRAEDFHQQQLEQHHLPLEVVQLDEMHARATDTKKGAARKTRNVSHREDRLLAALRLWRDWRHWVRPHASLHGHTPAAALGLTDHAWSVREYVRRPVHVGGWERELRAETWENLLTNGLNREKPLKPLPTS